MLPKSLEYFVFLCCHKEILFHYLCIALVCPTFSKIFFSFFVVDFYQVLFGICLWLGSSQSLLMKVCFIKQFYLLKTYLES